MQILQWIQSEINTTTITDAGKADENIIKNKIEIQKALRNHESVFVDGNSGSGSEKVRDSSESCELKDLNINLLKTLT